MADFNFSGGEVIINANNFAALGLDADSNRLVLDQSLAASDPFYSIDGNTLYIRFGPLSDGNSITILNWQTNVPQFFTQIVQDDGMGGFNDVPVDGGSAGDLSGTITDENAAPTFTSTATFSVDENQANVGTVAASDSDTPAQTIKYSISGGADAAFFAIDADTGVLTFVGGGANFEDQSRATGTPGVPDDPMTMADETAPAAIAFDNTYEVIVTADDGTGATDASTDQAIIVTVNDVNEAPEVSGDLQLEADEGETVLVTTNDLSAAADVFSVDAGGNVVAAPERIVYQITGQTNGSVIVDGVDTLFLPMGERSFTQAQLDAGLVEFRHNGSETTSGSFSVTVRGEEEIVVNGADTATADSADDLVVNGTPDTDTTSVTVDVDVTPVNDAPELDTGDLSVLEDNDGSDDPDAATNQLSGAQLLAEDAEDADETLTYTLDTAPTRGTLYRNGNTDGMGNVVTGPPAMPGGPAFDPALVVALGAGDTFSQKDVDDGRVFYDHDGSEPDPIGANDSFTVTVTDADGATDTGTVQIEVTQQNDAPTYPNPTEAVSAAENQTAVGTFAVDDPDALGSASYALSGDDASFFSIDSNGVLTFETAAFADGAPNFEDPQDTGADNDYDVTITATTDVIDSMGSLTTMTETASVDVIVTVTDANDDPDPDDDEVNIGEDPVGGVEGILISELLANDTQTAADGPFLADDDQINDGLSNDDDEDPAGTPWGDIDPASFTLVPSIAGLPASALIDLGGTDPRSIANVPVTVNGAGEIVDSAMHVIGQVVGTVSVSGNSVLIGPDAEYNGTPVFTYEVADQGGATGMAVVTVNVLAQPDAPVVLDNTFTGMEQFDDDNDEPTASTPTPQVGMIDKPADAFDQTPFSFTGGPGASGNNSGLFANLLTGELFSAGSGGANNVVLDPMDLVVDAAANPVSIGGASDADANTPDDGDPNTAQDNSDLSIIEIDILPGVDPVDSNNNNSIDPSELFDSGIRQVGESFEITDANGNTARVLLEADGRLRVDRLGDFSGDLSFQYTVSDAGTASNALTDTATFTLTLAPKNDAPRDVNQELPDIPEDDTNVTGGVDLHLLAEAHATNPDGAGEDLDLAPVDPMDPSQGFITDIQVQLNGSTISRTIQYTVDEETGIFTLTESQFNDLEEGDELRLRIRADYTDDSIDPDTGEPNTAQAQTIVTILGEDDPITANLVNAGELDNTMGNPAVDPIDENAVSMIDLDDMDNFNVLADDVDSPDAGALDPADYTIHIAGTTEAAPGSGIFVGEGIVFDATSGELTFTPNEVAALNNLPAGAVQLFSVGFTLEDMTGGPGNGDISNQGSITWTVTGQNDRPIFDAPYGNGATDVVFVDENTTGPVGTFGATDADGDTITYSLAVAPADAGRLSIDSMTGEVTLLQPLDFEGPDPVRNNDPFSISFRVLADDGTGSPNATTLSDTISLQARDVDDAPDAMDVTFNRPAGLPLTIDELLDFLADNVSDQDGEDFNLISVGNATGGGVVLNTFGQNPGDDPDDNITFTPLDNTVTQGTFTYTVREDSDPNGPAILTGDLEATGTVTINFTGGPANQPPVGVADSYGALSGATLIVTAGTGVLANDTDPENDPLTAALVAPAANGTVMLNADGSFTYDADPSFFGTDTFTYDVSDGTNTTGPVTVSIDVTGPVTPGPGDAVLTGFRDVFTSTSPDDIRILAGDGVDDISTGGGNDILVGEGGSDNLFGAGGNDILIGGLGNDVLSGGTGNDLFVVEDATFAGGDFLTDFDASEDTLQLAGFAGISTPGDLTFTMFAGDLAIDLGGRFVVFQTLGMSDQAAVEGAIDIVPTATDFSFNTTPPTIMLPGGTTNLRTSDTGVNLIDGGDGSNFITAADGADVINGNAGDDEIRGFDGDDVINGGAGSDILSGGNGANTFIFNEADETVASVDRITDYQAGVDEIEVNGFGATMLADLNPTASAAGVLLTLDADNLLLITNATAVGDLNAGDFTFS